MDQPEVSIIIVNYNTCDLLRNCLASIYKHSKKVSIEILVVDNDSKDQSEHMVKTEFPDVVWIQTGYNAGFGRANNIGMKAAKGKYGLILNSDTEFFENTLPISIQCHKELEKNGPVGVTSCAMVDGEGNVLFNSNTKTPFIKKIWNANPLVIAAKTKLGIKQVDIYKLRLDLHSKSHESEWIGGAFLLFNLSVFKEMDLYLDEDFFMYGEDIEWCERIRRNGLRHFFYTDTTVLHYDGGSPNPSRNRMAQVMISGWLCMKKIKGNAYFFLYCILLLVNYLLDETFYKLAKARQRTTETDDKAREERRFILNLLNTYFYSITMGYRRRPSSAKNFLKYAN